MAKKGVFILIIGPSGVGKGTVIAKIKEKHPEFVYPISATTRPQRPNEKEGDVYHFWNKDQFEKAVYDGDFLEWAIVHKDYCYGTLKKPIMEALEAGKVVLRELDVQGFQSIRERLKDENLVTIFISPPSFDALKERILKRGEMEPEVLEKRLESARKELEISKECDHIVVNPEGKVEEAVAEIEGIIKEAIDRE